MHDDLGRLPRAALARRFGCRLVDELDRVLQRYVEQDRSVQEIVAEGFERIHRTNLVGMGVLPLEFKAGETRQTYAIDGTETFDVVGQPMPRADLTVVMHRKNGERVEIPVTCRLDTAEEVSVYAAGGVLQRFAQDFLEAANG